MTVLIIYSDIGKNIQTIQSHLNSFKKYGKGNTFFYLELSRPENLSQGLLNISFDLVIFHYTFLALRFAPDNFKRLYNELAPKLSALKGTKVLLPQDEYIYTEFLWRIINDCDIKRIYSCMKAPDYSILYPEEKIGKREDLFRNVYTGYVDEKLLKWIEKHQIPHNKRKWDLVFRSTRSTYTFGMMGQQKTKIAEGFMEAVKYYPSLNTDICLTLPNSYTNTITGARWIEFLLNSRTALGTLSGSSLFDPDGSIKETVQAYLCENPNATDEDIERECYCGRDGKITSFVLGPRHFECAMTKTCQVLLEGEYDNMEPGVDYIEVKADFSNIRQVLELIQDHEYCEQVAEHCYSVFVLQNKLRYSDFVHFILDDAAQLVIKKNEDLPTGAKYKIQTSLSVLQGSQQAYRQKMCEYEAEIRRTKKEQKRLYAKQREYVWKNQATGRILILKQKTTIKILELQNIILLLSQHIKMYLMKFEAFWRLFQQKMNMRLMKMEVTGKLLYQRIKMWEIHFRMTVTLLKQRLIMQRLRFQQKALIFSQRMTMLKYAAIDFYYVSGRRILKAVEPSHPRIYKLLCKLRQLLKRHNGNSDLK